MEVKITQKIPFIFYESCGLELKFLFLCVIFFLRLINKKLANLDTYRVRQIFTQASNNWAQVSRLSFEEKNNTNTDIQITFER